MLVGEDMQTWCYLFHLRILLDHGFIFDLNGAHFPKPVDGLGNDAWVGLQQD